MKGTALLSWRNSLDGELWPAAQKVGCGQQLWGHPNTVSLMSGTGPTPQAQLSSPLRGWPSESKLSFQPSTPAFLFTFCFSQCLPLTGWRQGLLGPESQSQQKQQVQLPHHPGYGGCDRN